MSRLAEIALAERRPRDAIEEFSEGDRSDLTGLSRAATSASTWRLAARSIRRRWPIPRS
jgi:hypothetical protein